MGTEEESSSPEWIEVVVRPLKSDPELAMAARAELQGLSLRADAQQCRAIGERLGARDAGPWRNWRRTLPWIPSLLALALLGLAFSEIRFLRNLRELVAGLVGYSGGSGTALEEQLGAELSEEDRLLIFGDPSQPRESLARKALWDLHPENPAYFSEYLAATDPLPPGFLDTAARLDPENGWFPLLAAGALAPEAVERRSKLKKPRSRRSGARSRSRTGQSHPDPPAPPPDEPAEEDREFIHRYDLLDSEKLAEAIALLQQAAEAGRIENYQPSLLARRLEILPPESDFKSRIFRLLIAASNDNTNSFRVLRILDLIAAEAQRLAAAGEREELRQLVRHAEILCHRLAHLEGTMIDALIARAIAFSVYEHLHHACEEAAMAEEAGRLLPKLTALRSVRDLSTETPAAEQEQLQRHGELFTILVSSRALTSYGVNFPSVEEMRPGRLMNYALFERLALWVLAISLLLLVIPLTLLPRLRGRLAQQLGMRFALLFRPADWTWIAALGTVLPLLWYCLISWLTPLGCRDWSLTYMMFQPAQLQASLVPFLVLAATLHAVRWRLARRAGSLGFGLRRPLRGLLPPLLIALAIPLAGLVRYFGESEFPLHLSGGIALLVSLWFLFLGARTLFGDRELALGRIATARLLIPALGGAAVLAFLLVPVTDAAERHYLARDTLLRTTPENLGMGKVEAGNTAAIYRALREALARE